MNSKGRWAIGLVSVLSLVVLTCVFSTSKKENSKEVQEKNAVFSITIPTKLDFAGEKVPLEFFDVREALDKELQINAYWQSQTILLIKRANRFFLEIDPILKEEGLPSDFKYLALAESGLTNVVSPANAVGFWQFLKNTGKEYNLQIDNEVDERYNLEKSTRAACKFLKESYKLYQSWTLAAASYNMGRIGVSKQLDSQKEKNYYDLGLNDETARYLYRILALKLIIETPELYGFHIQRVDLYPPLRYIKVEVNGSIPDLADFAQKNNTNYKMLKLFNPWLREKSLVNKAKINYTIKIPTKGYRESVYLELLAKTDSVLVHKEIIENKNIGTNTKQ